MKPARINGRWYPVDNDGKKIFHYPFDNENAVVAWIDRQKKEKQLSKYEEVGFIDDLGIRRKAFAVSDWLVIYPNRDGYWKIVVRPTKQKAVNITFETALEAIKFAQSLVDVYKEFFPAWLTGLDPFSIAKWTVKDGLALWSLLEYFDEKTISLSILNTPETQRAITTGISWWTRGQNWR